MFPMAASRRAPMALYGGALGARQLAVMRPRTFCGQRQAPASAQHLFHRLVTHLPFVCFISFTWALRNLAG